MKRLLDLREGQKSEVEKARISLMDRNLVKKKEDKYQGNTCANIIASFHDQTRMLWQRKKRSQKLNLKCHFHWGMRLSSWVHKSSSYFPLVRTRNLQSFYFYIIMYQLYSFLQTSFCIEILHNFPCLVSMELVKSILQKSGSVGYVVCTLFFCNIEQKTCC